MLKLLSLFVSMPLYTFEVSVTLFPLPFSELVSMRRILFMSADHSLLECFDTVGWAV